MIEPLYDASRVVPEASSFGAFLKTMFGYNADPSLTEVIGYVGYVACIAYVLRPQPARHEKPERA